MPCCELSVVLFTSQERDREKIIEETISERTRQTGCYDLPARRSDGRAFISLAGLRPQPISFVECEFPTSCRVIKTTERPSKNMLMSLLPRFQVVLTG